MLDNTPQDDIRKWTVTTLQSVFEEAVFSFAKDYQAKMPTVEKHRSSLLPTPLPPVYVDCGNTLFDKSGDTPTIKPDFLNFLIALKNGGYDIRLMSHEPLKYVDILRDELVARGLSHRVFEDKGGLSILRKEVANNNTQGLVLIDNDVFSIPIQIKRRIFPDDAGFIEELKSYQDFETAIIPDEVRADVLWAKATGRSMPPARPILYP
jgi:hypothetical protein